MDEEEKEWENGEEMKVKGLFYGSGSIFLPGQVHCLINVICPIVYQNLFLIIFLCEHAYVGAWVLEEPGV